MAYTIYNTDGTVLLILGEGKTDSITTSITLVGKNVPSYGEILNNDLVKIMANFAGPNEPNGPVIGQLWYDTTTGRVKVYDSNQLFRPISNTIVGPYQPVNLVPEDYWFDSTNHQLYFTLDGSTVYNIGPASSSKFGQVGWIGESVYDAGGVARNVTKLYSNNYLVGIFSTASFNLALTTAGMTTVGIGFNLNTSITGMRFVGTATSADSVAGITVGQFLRSDINTSTQGSLTIGNDLGLQVVNSTYDQLSLYADSTTHVGTLAYNSTDNPFKIQVAQGAGGAVTPFYVDAANLNVGIWTETPLYSLDIVGSTRIQGDLIIEGTSTTITSVNLQVYDKNIELGYGQSLDDGGASGGGLTLHGTTDHTLHWVLNNGWTSNDTFNVPYDKSYKVGGNPVIYANSLSTYVTSAPGLTSVGTLSALRTGNIKVGQVNSFTSFSGSLSGTSVNAINSWTLYLQAGNSTGTVNVTNHRIADVATPADDHDAATKKYVDDALYLSRTTPLSLTLDVTNFTNLQDSISACLSAAFPVVNTAPGESIFDLPDGTRASVICGTSTVITTTATVNVNWATDLVDKGGVQYDATVVSGVQGAIAAQLPAQVYTPIVKYDQLQFWKVVGGVWTYDRVVMLSL